MPVGMQIGLGPGHIVRDRDPTHLPPQKKGRAESPVFGPCLSWPNGWIDQDATWYEGMPRPRPYYITCGSSLLPTVPKRGTAPNFRPMSIVAKRSPISAIAEHLLLTDCDQQSHFQHHTHTDYSLQKFLFTVWAN